MRHIPSRRSLSLTAVQPGTAAVRRADRDLGACAAEAVRRPRPPLRSMR